MITKQRECRRADEKHKKLEQNKRWFILILCHNIYQVKQVVAKHDTLIINAFARTRKNIKYFERAGRQQEHRTEV